MAATQRNTSMLLSELSKNHNDEEDDLTNSRMPVDCSLK